MIVYCDRSDCLNNENFKCNRDCISVGEDYDFCDSYKTHLDTPEYQELFYKRVKTKYGTEAKAPTRGKKILYNGYVFYTESAPNDKCYCTDKRTGYAVGDLEELKQPERWKIFIDIQSKTEDVNALPLAYWDGHEYILSGITIGV